MASLPFFLYLFIINDFLSRTVQVHHSAKMDEEDGLVGLDDHLVSHELGAPNQRHRVNLHYDLSANYNNTLLKSVYFIVSQEPCFGKKLLIERHSSFAEVLVMVSLV